MLFTRGKARWVEEFVALYLMGHHTICINDVGRKVYDATDIQVTISTIRSVIYEMKNWGYLATSNLMYGNYTLTSKGAEYYGRDFENCDFTCVDPDKVNVNV